MSSTIATDYNRFHAERAARLISNQNQPDLRGMIVLVVGANTGKDCRYFKDFGALEVHGLDVLENTGADFQAPSVYYHVESAENMSLPGNSFDLVYCFATMEHIPRIDLAFQEMARVTRPGGFIYCVSAPLWQSRYGHHMKELFGEPWVHLRMTPEELLTYCQRHNITERSDGEKINNVVRYLYDPQNMNQLPPQRYVDAGKDLPGMKVMLNQLEMNQVDSLPHNIIQELFSLGYPKENIMAEHHTYIGQKALCQDKEWEPNRATLLQIIKYQGRRLGEIGAERNKYDAELNNLQAELIALKATLSWRITSPLRWIRKRLKAAKSAA